MSLCPTVLWLSHFPYSVVLLPIPSLDTCVFAVPQVFIAGVACRAWDGESSGVPCITFGFRGCSPSIVCVTLKGHWSVVLYMIWNFYTRLMSLLNWSGITGNWLKFNYILFILDRRCDTRKSFRSAPAPSDVCACCEGLLKDWRVVRCTLFPNGN